jgi:hypothetical protein
MKAQKVVVACPACGHQQPEPITAYSTVCKKCRKHYRVQEATPSRRRPSCPRRATLAASSVLTAARNSMCPLRRNRRCARSAAATSTCAITRFTNATSKNFKTRGRFVIEEGAYLFNTDTTANEVVLKGRFLGKLTAEKSLGGLQHFRTEGNLHLRTCLSFLRVIGFAGRMPFNSAALTSPANWWQTFARNRRSRSAQRRASLAMLKPRGLVIEPGAVFVGQAKIKPSL